MDDNSIEILEVADKFQHWARVLCHALYMCQYMHKMVGYFFKRNCVYQANLETFPPFTL